MELPKHSQTFSLSCSSHYTISIRPFHKFRNSSLEQISVLCNITKSWKQIFNLRFLTLKPFLTIHHFLNYNVYPFIKSRHLKVCLIKSILGNKMDVFFSDGPPTDARPKQLTINTGIYLSHSWYWYASMEITTCCFAWGK